MNPKVDFDNDNNMMPFKWACDFFNCKGDDKGICKMEIERRGPGQEKVH